MDPVANLKEQRQIVMEAIAELDLRAPTTHLEDLAERLVELVHALDEWRCNGGFDPYTDPDV